jgi:Domain of unknown function (DUF4178)
VSYAASCPSCGGSLVFGLGSSLLKVCEHCGVAVARKGANLEAYGKVAELIPTPSVLSLGQKGDYKGAPPFELVGRLQISHGSGSWDEWLMAFRGGSWAWLSESQGKFHYMGSVPVPPLPEFSDVKVGQTLDLGNAGTFVVTEVNSGRFASAQGELPFDTAPGSELHYADLQGPHAQFATIDYGTGEAVEALYVGREVSLEELGFKNFKPPEAAPAAARGQSLSCPQCGGPLEIRAPDQTQRVACPYCGSLLDATRDLAVLEALNRVKLKPIVPLGATGTLDGVAWTCIGCMERSVTVEGVRYAWQEYLLYEPRHGFRWLVLSKGHWSFVSPARAGDVAFNFGAPSYEGRRFKHFQSGRARVDQVLGEFYWEVARGDMAETADYVAPPYMLSEEKTEKEAVYSLGRYLEPQEVFKAFGLPGKPPEREGVAPNQPWPHASTGGVFATALSFSALAFFLYLVLSVIGGRMVQSEKVAIAPGAVSGAPESASFSEPFEISSEGNVEIQVNAPVNNSWLYLDGALINDATGGLDEFDAEVSYYHGTDSDGSWSEGGQHARAFVGEVPPGRYVLRLAPQWEAGKAPSGYDVIVRSRVPRFYQLVLAELALWSWPLLLLWRRGRFEAQRWAESDHPWVSSGGDDE